MAKNIKNWLSVEKKTYSDDGMPHIYYMFEGREFVKDYHLEKGNGCYMSLSRKEVEWLALEIAKVLAD